MTYVTIVLAVFGIAALAGAMLFLSRRRKLLQLMEERTERQAYQLPRLQRMTALFADKTRPVAEFETEARRLIAELRVSDTDGQLAPALAHFEGQLATRR